MLKAPIIGLVATFSAIDSIFGLDEGGTDLNDVVYFKGVNSPRVCIPHGSAKEVPNQVPVPASILVPFYS